MSRKFISAVLAASLTITTLGAVPARADQGDDLAKFLGVAATLLILGKALDNHKQDKKQKKATVQQPKQKPRAKPRSEYHAGKDRWQRRALQPLPQRCVRRVEGKNHDRIVVGQRCLDRNYFSARPLPGECRVRIGQPSGRDVRGYGLRCLRRNGYEVARR